MSTGTGGTRSSAYPLRQGDRGSWRAAKAGLVWLALGIASLGSAAGCAKRRSIKSITSPGSSQLKVIARLDQSAVIFDEIMSSADQRVPEDILRDAQCVVLIPGLSSYSFVVGAQWGSGFVSCRAKDGVGWTAPGAVSLKGGSFGLQIGGRSTNLLLLVMNKNAESKLLSDQFTLGVDASAAAGPVGRSVGAQTNAAMRAEILSWSQSSGLFAGVSLQGAALREDHDTLKALYGQEITNAQVVEGGHKVPEAAKLLVSVLNKYSPRAGRARS